MQSAFAAEQLAEQQEASQVASQQVALVSEEKVPAVEEPLPGPLQPISEADLVLTATAEPEVIPAPTVVSTPAQPVEQVAVDAESGGS